MQRTRIKICGITTREDALAAAQAGVDALGLILYAPGNPRQIDANAARDIAMALPPFVSAIGVTVDCSPNRVRQLLAHVPLSMVQFNGRESVQDVRFSQPTAAIKRLAAGPELASQVEAWAKAIIPNLAGLVVDACANADGEAEWNSVERLLGSADRAALPPITLAGNVRPENVADIVRRFRPWAVDVTEGVEEAPGRKSPQRLRELITAVRSVKT